MYKVVYENYDYRIIEHTKTKYKRKKTVFILENKFGGKRNHVRFKRYNQCKSLIEIMNVREIPNDKKLQNAIIRVNCSFEYINDIISKQLGIESVRGDVK